MKKMDCNHINIYGNISTSTLASTKNFNVFLSGEIMNYLCKQVYFNAGYFPDFMKFYYPQF